MPATLKLFRKSRLMQLQLCFACFQLHLLFAANLFRDQLSDFKTFRDVIDDGKIACADVSMVKCRTIIHVLAPSMMPRLQLPLPPRLFLVVIKNASASNTLRQKPAREICGGCRSSCSSIRMSHFNFLLMLISATVEDGCPEGKSRSVKQYRFTFAFVIYSNLLLLL